MPTVPMYQKRGPFETMNATRMPTSLGYAASTQGLRRLPPSVSHELPQDIGGWLTDVMGDAYSAGEDTSAESQTGNAGVVQGMLKNLNDQAARFGKIQQETDLVSAKNGFEKVVGNLLAQAGSKDGPGFDYQEVKQALGEAESEEIEKLSEPYTSAFRMWASTQGDKLLAKLQSLEQGKIINQASQQRSLFMAQKQTDYGEAAPKQRALIEHEVADLLNRQVMSGLISPGQANVLHTQFVNSVSSDSVKRALNNALNSGQPVKAIEGVIKELQEGAPSGLDNLTRAQMTTLAGEMLKQAQSTDKLKRINSAQDDAWFSSGGEPKKAQALVSNQAFKQKHSLEDGDKAALVDGFKARKQLMDEQENIAKSSHAASLISQALDQVSQGKPQDALALVQVHSDDLGTKAAKNLRSLVLTKNIKTSSEDWAQALDEVFSSNKKPSIDWMLDKGVFPDKAAELVAAYEDNNKSANSSEPNYFAEGLKYYEQSTGQSGKLKQKQPEYIANLWSLMQKNNLSLNSPELANSYEPALEQVLLKEAAALDW